MGISFPFHTYITIKKGKLLVKRTNSIQYNIRNEKNCQDKRQKIFPHTDIVLHSANTSEIQATKKPHNYHKIAVWQKDDRIRKSPLKFCVYYYSELEGDCQASIITELCRLSVVFCVTLWHMRNSVWFCTRGEWACSPIGRPPTSPIHSVRYWIGCRPAVFP